MLEPLCDMTVTTYCPYCRSAVAIEGAGRGHRAKCSSCLTEFDPTARNRHVSDPLAHGRHGENSTPATDPVTVADVEDARAEVGRLTAQGTLLKSETARRRREAIALSTESLVLKLAARSRQFCDESMSRIGALFIFMTLGGAMFVVVAHIAGASLLMGMAAVLLGTVLSVTLFVPLVFYPRDKSIATMQSSLQRRLDTAIAQRNYLAQKIAQHEREFARTQVEYDRLARASESRLNWLRTCHWPMMTGDYFEKFLSEVFLERGYDVEMTGKAGDQGVDLIVTRQGVRVAIQAKGYTSGNVGNTAVQEAHAGMTHHRCHRAAVVTNSRFTSGAQELADSVGCQLIDGSQIPDVIDGKIWL